MHFDRVDVRIQICYVIMIILTSVIINTGVEVYAQSTNNTNSTPIETNELVNASKPNVVVEQNCPVASTVIPGFYNASGFPPNTHLGVVIKSENISLLNTSDTRSPITGLHNDITDSLGNIGGQFNIDTTRVQDKGYQLEIFVDDNRDDLPDVEFEAATSPVGC